MLRYLSTKKWFASALLLGLLIYVLTLVVGFYNSQEQLRTVADAELHGSNKQTAALIRDFLDEQANFAQKLTESPEIQNYLSNAALGMSMRYGLGQNIYEINQMLKRVIDQKKIFGEDAYQRILFANKYGEILADTQSGGSLPIPLIGQLERSRRLLDATNSRITEIVPVRFHGEYAGAVFTITSLSTLQGYLRSSQTNTVLDQILINQSGKIIAGSDANIHDAALEALSLNSIPANQIVGMNKLPSIAGTQPLHDSTLLLRSDIAGTDLSLVTIVKESTLYGRMATQAFFALAVLGPLLMGIIITLIVWIKSRNRRLEAVVLESQKSQMLLRDENEELNAEISKRIAIEKDLRASEERYRTYIDHAPEGIFVFDKNGYIVDANDSVGLMLGYDKNELKGQPVRKFFPKGDFNLSQDVINRLSTNSMRETQTTLVTRSGGQVYADLKFVLLPADRTMCFCIDMTEHKKAQEQIHSLAYFDPLTGLPNRRLLIDRIQQALIRCRRTKKHCAVLMIDLDHFKNLNDSMGHDVGDLLLCSVSKRLTDSVRQNDTVARLGGDEFVVLLESIDLETNRASNQLNLIVSKIHAALNQPHQLVKGKPEYRCGSSIGIALSVESDSTVELLLKQADVALYAAKNDGRNTYKRFTDEMQAVIDNRAMIENSLRRALSEKELRLYCQGQTDSAGRVTGAEVLLRWISNQHQPSIPPSDFIPLAEETGLISEIGNWVLYQACEKLERWQRSSETSKLTLSVNISGRHFHQAEFADYLVKLLNNYSFPPNRLMIELTESILLDNVDSVAKKMARLKDLGVQFSLDDFGTGYSSLSYLKVLPIDEIKIDQSFVRDITTDQNDAAIVRAIVAMSQTLEFDVIAEGVETTAQRDFLLSNGCGRFQGYLFSRPIPIEDFLQGESSQVVA